MMEASRPIIVRAHEKGAGRRPGPSGSARFSAARRRDWGTRPNLVPAKKGGDVELVQRRGNLFGLDRARLLDRVLQQQSGDIARGSVIVRFEPALGLVLACEFL